jgi:predicted ribosome quality control (RQC) complex YloA/Tae2 family protein
VHNNYFFLKRLADKLDSLLSGTILNACFSQEKNELVLGFFSPKDNREHWVNAVLKSDFSCLYFPESFNRARKNSIDLFDQLIDKTVIKVTQISFDRSFFIQFSDEFQLMFKMHGNRSNLVLFRSGESLDAFKKNLKNDQEIVPGLLNRKDDLSRHHFFAVNGDIHRLTRTFGKIPDDWLIKQGYSNATIDKKWKLFAEMMTYLNTGPIRVETKTARLVLLPFQQEEKLFQDPLKGINTFFKIRTQQDRHFQMKRAIHKQLKSTREKLNRYISKTNRELQKFKDSVPPNQIADILMANLHQIDPQSTCVELPNFYDQNKPITIQLKKGLSPQKNAEQYYRKAKRRHLEEEQLKINLEERSRLARQIEADISRIENDPDPQWLTEQYKKRFEDNKPKKETTLPFKSFEIDGFKIWVGKNAQSNDKLTQLYGHKNDLWLHAKDVSGSHVLIKFQAGKTVPVSIKEKAAGLAAYYSKRKNESLVPVICTPRKYVRKSKGLPAGAVKVEKEDEVLMVPPWHPL